MATASSRWGLALTGLLAFAGLTTRPSPALAEAADRPIAEQVTVPFKEHTLSNGLRVLLAPDSAARRVAVRLYFLTGTASDPPGLRGLGRVVGAFLRDPSTRHVPRSLRASLFRALGVEEWEVSHSVDYDETELSFTVAPPELGIALWLESDRMAFLLDGVDEHTLQQKVASMQPSGGVFVGARRFGQAALVGDAHPYGGEPTPARAGVNDVRDHYKKHFVPRNTVLALAGNFDPVTAKAQIEEMFGPITDAPAPDQPTAPKVELSAPRRVHVEANVPQPECVMMWPTPPYLDPDDLVLDGLASVLRRRFEARLVDAKLASAVASRQGSDRLGSTFYVAAAAAEGRTAEEMERLLDAELDDLRKEAPSEIEGARAQRYLLTNTLTGLSTPLERTYFLTRFLHMKGQADFLPRFLAGYEAISSASVQRVLQKYLGKGRVVVTVTPSPSAPGSGRLLKGSGK